MECSTPIGSRCSFNCHQVLAADRDEWRRCIDTALPSPEDIQPWEDAPVVKQTTYMVQPRSIVLLALALDEGAEAHQVEPTQIA